MMKMNRRLVPILALLLSSVHCSATWTLTQVKNTATCSSSSTTCAVTLSSTGSGHLLVAAAITASSSAKTISSVTAALCSGSWVHCSNCSLAASGDGSVDFSYCLNSASGQTSGTITISASPGSAWDSIIWEASSSLGNIALDSGTTASGTKNDSSACTGCAGVSLTLSGNNDFIAAIAACGGSCTGLSGTGWTNDLSNPQGDGTAHGITSGSQTAPATWTQSSGTLAAAAIAFQETSGGASASGFNKQRKIDQMEGIIR